MTTGERIKTARKKANLTQKELGRKLNVSGTMIAMYETNARNPKFNTLRRIAEALSCNITDLIPIQNATLLLKENNETPVNSSLSSLIPYMESLGYTVLVEEEHTTYKKGYCDLELSEDEQETLDNYGYVQRVNNRYLITKNNIKICISEEDILTINYEMSQSLAFYLWKYTKDE